MLTDVYIPITQYQMLTIKIVTNVFYFLTENNEKYLILKNRLLRSIKLPYTAMATIKKCQDKAFLKRKTK